MHTMHRIAITPDDLDQAVREAAGVLRAGGVIVAPTETVYGLMTRWDNLNGRDRIFELKCRPREKHLQMLAANLETARPFGLRMDSRLHALAARFWPGPLTIVCLMHNGETVGLRIPDHPFAQALLRQLGTPVAATSANRSAEPPAQLPDDAVQGLNGQPDLLIDGGRTAGTASTVVSLTGPDLELIRAGPIAESALRAALSGSDTQP
jgi:L-threonylcarbamoyladenylate synthase